ncbi:hypothetical protein [Marinobacter sp.]|uniref:hypothetical protein n=1 Tax=Marinobacter sp. TaxID=50741 RepID=UPI0035C6F083
MRKAVPWATVGFIAGAALGFAWGQKAKSRLGESVKTDFSGGRLTVEVDTVTAAASGLPDPLAAYIAKQRG